MAKHVMDVSTALIGLVIFSPLLLVIALAIKLDSRGPVFFRQIRCGRHGRSFSIFKFRTMTADAGGLLINHGN